MDLLKQLTKGEPVLIIAGVISALLASVGVVVTDGVVAQFIVAAVPVVMALIARTRTTPKANPEIPHVVVDGDGNPISSTEPVITLSGRRP